MTALQRWGFGLMTLAAALTALTGWMLAGRARALAPAVAEVPVVAAAAAIPPATRILPEMLVLRPLPVRYVHPHLYTDPGLVAGQLARVPIRSGEWISAGMVAPADGLAADRRLLTLTAGAVVRIDSPLAAGDRVDIFASYREGERAVTRLLLAGVPVAAVEEQESRRVTLVVTLDEARDLIWQENYGQELRLLRRPHLAAVEPAAGAGQGRPGP